jgi:hypothetical protein
LTAFKITGFLDEPPTIAETITREPVTWEFEKCSRSTDYPLWFRNPNNTYASSFYSDGLVSIIYIIVPDRYWVAHSIYGSSVVPIWSNLTVSTKAGFIESLRITFNETYESSEVKLWTTEPNNIVDKMENISVTKWVYSFSGDWDHGEYEKAIIEAVGENEPRSIMFNLPIEWILNAQQNVSQQLEIATEVTYFNGTNYVKVVLPILIKLIADVGNTFETSKTITAGNYRGYLSAFGEDITDCYRISLLKNQTVKLNVALRGVEINLTLYDPEENPRASISSGRYYDTDPHFTEELTYDIDADGYWYIKLQAGYDNGISFSL